MLSTSRMRLEFDNFLVFDKGKSLPLKAGASVPKELMDEIGCQERIPCVINYRMTGVISHKTMVDVFRNNMVVCEFLLALILIGSFKSNHTKFSMMLHIVNQPFSQLPNLF